jgi:hypothetical protein
MTRILGIEIGEREVRIARGERRFGTVRITTVERHPFADVAALPAVLSALARPRPDLVLAAFPAERTTHRVLVLPFRDRRRIARTAPLELLGQLPLDEDGVAVVAEPLGPARGGTAVLAAAIRRDELDTYAAMLGTAGLRPTRIDVAPLPAWNLLPLALDDVALVVADGGRSTLALWRAGRVAGFRALGAAGDDPDALAAEVRWSLVALGGIPPTIIVAGADAAARLVAALGAGGTRVVGIAEAASLPVEHLGAGAVAAGLVAGVGRRQRTGLALGGERPTGHGSFRRTAALAGAVVALGALDLGLAHFELAHRDGALAQAIQAEAAAALPGTRLVAPRAQLDAAAAAAARRNVRLGDQSSVLDLLRELSARVGTTIQLDLDELTVERDGVLVHGRCGSFEAVDVLRRALAASPVLADVTADETRSTVDGRRVEFRLRAARRPALGASS